MLLIEKINDDLKNAMKNQEKEKLSVIRMLKGSIQLAKTELKRDLTDEEVIDIVTKQVKMRNESIKEFDKAGRSDLKDQYQSEVDILNTYLPEQLSREEVMSIIDEVFADIQPNSMKQMGMIIKEVSPKVKGRFEMSEVSKIVKEKLENM